MRQIIFRLTALTASTALMTACASSLPPLSVAPPRLSLPTAATTPCRLDRLPADPTVADLEAVYIARGAAIVACDGARDLAVQTLIAERALQDRWREETAPKRRFPFWPF